jgi:hypothetical protein
VFGPERHDELDPECASAGGWLSTSGNPDFDCE